MKLQQLRYIWEVAHHDLNVSATALSLFTSQPGISKQIRLLEDELGVEIFARSGKHLTRVTPAGKMVIDLAGEMLRTADNIKRVAQEFSNEKRGSLILATTHTQARFILPEVISQFMEKYPDVTLSLKQGTPPQIAQMVSDGEADLAIATESIASYNDLVTLPCYQWNRCILVPKDHALAQEKNLTLEKLAEYPLVTYISGFTGRAKVDEAFAKAELEPKIVFTAADSDVIKTYVRLGVGIGIVAHMAADENEQDLAVLDASHLFEPSITRLGIRRGTFMRGYFYDFIEKLAAHLDRDTLDQALVAGSRQEIDQMFAGLELPKR
ncbi:HTH-type transcriptional regulator CysB [Marinospirillum sp.]|uniref:HTH-type transcriptional regulator CysB n=1 Tax=Marinospirillum sp. TaxID=2183934 RepID=UPI00384C4DFA